ncbi:hypothetical protein Tco_1070042 [Tanacetum coccineum]|uniref:Uncharacterized protein n=1 Tax=Tanacetum coccineum TaxID=301880 RepID=A0ABQ5HK99_9ASTR
MRMSEAGDEDYNQQTFLAYQAKYGVPFTLTHCWKELKDYQKEGAGTNATRVEKAKILNNVQETKMFYLQHAHHLTRVKLEMALEMKRVIKER